MPHPGAPSGASELTSGTRSRGLGAHRRGPRAVKIDAAPAVSGFVRRLFFFNSNFFDKIFSHGQHWERAPGSGRGRTVPAPWPAAGPHPTLREEPTARTRPVARRAPRPTAGRPEIACPPCPGHPTCSGHRRGQVLGAGRWGCRAADAPAPTPLPPSRTRGCPGASPGGRPALGTLVLSAFPSGNGTEIAEGREGMERARRPGGSSPGRRQLWPGRGRGAEPASRALGLGWRGTAEPEGTAPPSAPSHVQTASEQAQPPVRAGGGRAGLSLPPRGTACHRCWEFWACWRPPGRPRAPLAALGRALSCWGGHTGLGVQRWERGRGLLDPQVPLPLGRTLLPPWWGPGSASALMHTAPPLPPPPHASLVTRPGSSLESLASQRSPSPLSWPYACPPFRGPCGPPPNTCLTPRGPARATCLSPRG